MAESEAHSFTFISGDPRCQAAQEAIRVHVMRLQHRQRRQRQKSQKDVRPEGHFEGQFHIWQFDKALPVPQKQPDPPTPISIGGSSDEPSLDTEYTRGVERCTEELSPPPFIDTLGHPSVVAEPASVGPKQSTEEMLIEYYLQYGGGSKVTHDLFRAYSETTATFSIFLAMVATNYSDEKGEDPPVDTAELENKALREVNQQLSRSPTAPASSTMLTVALLANLRECRHEHDLVKWHWNGLRQMVEINGGVQRLRMHQDLYTFFFWLEGVVTSTSVTSIGQYPNAAANNDDPKQELLDFFRDVTNQVSTMAGVDSSLNTRLTSPILTALRQPSFKKDSYSIGKWRRAKLASLLFLAALSLQSKHLLQDDPDYQAIEMDVLDRERKYIVYPEELYYILVRICNQDHLCQLTWKVARLVSATKQLEQRDINTCYRLLSSYLGFADPYWMDLVSDEWVELSARVFMNA